MATKMRLGILTWRNGRYIEEITYFTHLAQEAEKLNTEVLLFAPQDQLRSGQIRALVYERGKGWISKICNRPDLVYDRFRNMQPEAFRKFVHFRSRTQLPFLNSRLAHKWNLHRFLDSQPQIAKWLPETAPLDSPKEALRMLSKYPMIYIKPVNGTGGKGILSITRKDAQHFLAVGRDTRRNKIKRALTSIAALSSFVSKWTKNSKYIVQQGLNLQWEPGLVTDFRLLVQKNGNGSWEITGLGGKIGGKDSATSNLHGGGKAVKPELYLKRYLSPTKCQEVFEECNQLGLQVAQALEAKFGRLTELGIDLGIDKEGKVWIIEINNKPGRDIFHKMGDVENYRKAVRRPVEYARYLFDNRQL